jgi:hypothetical protein
MRAVAPFAVLLVIYAVTMAAHLVEEPDLGDPTTLSPTGTGRDGSSRLAAMLDARGVEVVPVNSATRAVSAVGLRAATVFVPAPDFVGPELAARVAALPGRHRVVVVAPGLLTSSFWAPGAIAGYPSRWAAKAVDPDCADPLARQAGRAAALRTRYAVELGAIATRDCYHGGLVGVRRHDTEVVLVGASDPFRNGRIGEGGNAELAVGLLAEFDRVVWLDAIPLT